MNKNILILASIIATANTVVPCWFVMIVNELKGSPVIVSYLCDLSKLLITGAITFSVGYYMMNRSLKASQDQKDKLARDLYQHLLSRCVILRQIDASELFGETQRQLWLDEAMRVISDVIQESEDIKSNMLQSSQIEFRHSYAFLNQILQNAKNFKSTDVNQKTDHWKTDLQNVTDNAMSFASDELKIRFPNGSAI